MQFKKFFSKYVMFIFSSVAQLTNLSCKIESCSLVTVDNKKEHMHISINVHVY